MWNRHNEVVLLNKRVALAAPRLRVLVKINEVELPERFKYLLYVRLGEIEVKGSDVELHAGRRGIDAWRKIQAEMATSVAIF